MSCWILLRGLTRERRHWGDFPDLLQTALPAARIVAIDLPGTGNLNATKSPTRIEDIASHCRAQAKNLGLQPPFHILAMSLGAMVAVAWANAHPNEVGSCVLVNTSLRRYSPFHHRLQPRSYASLLQLLLPGTDRAREAIVFKLTSRRADAMSEVLDGWISYRRECPVSAGNALRQLLAAARYRASPNSPSARLLILAGMGDMLVHPECSRRLAQAWQTNYAEHPWAGHDLALDDGAWVARRVADWWSPSDTKHQPAPERESGQS